MAAIENNTESWKGHTFPEVEQHIKLEELKSLLAKAPEIIKRESGTGAGVFEINHPLINYPGAECILVVYHKKTNKIRKGSYKYKFGYGRPKKGFCVFVNTSFPNRYFDFLKFNTLPNLRTFFTGIWSKKCNCKTFGIVFRIPNPEYTGPTTLDKNATYYGKKEMLWSDIKKIKISKGNNSSIDGIGLTF